MRPQAPAVNGYGSEGASGSRGTSVAGSTVLERRQPKLIVLMGARGCVASPICYWPSAVAIRS
jgi:hypothetical protein